MQSGVAWLALVGSTDLGDWPSDLSHQAGSIDVGDLPHNLARLGWLDLAALSALVRPCWFDLAAPNGLARPGWLDAPCLNRSG